ncbi:M23 family metallopeptidase [Candidatus Latescibacterota bacterium]
MNFIKENRLFTLTIVPDGGNDVKSGNINLRFITGFFAFLILMFFIMLFFVIGYHIKLSQENKYADAVLKMREHIDIIKNNENLVYNIAEKISKIQQTDKAFRQFAYMPVPDDNMYLAGIGGHMIVDKSVFAGLENDLQNQLKDLYLLINTLDRQMYIVENSLIDISNTNRESRDELNNTPLMLPVLSLNITSKYGMRTNPVTGLRQFHDAVDFTGTRGDKIFATADGIVTEAEFHSVRGNYVIIKHKYGYLTLYAHLDKILVKKGQTVSKEEVIGTMGRTGRTTGTNLHYSITHNNRKVNPLDYF